MEDKSGLLALLGEMSVLLYRVLPVKDLRVLL